MHRLELKRYKLALELKLGEILRLELRRYELALEPLESCASLFKTE
jgi:hypothetical protein